jgi:2-methylcitrate dehydratase PrpD
VQSVLFAIDGLMTENALAAQDIDRMVVHCSTMAHRHCAWAYEPRGVTAAQMNLFFTSAMMIVDRAAMQDQFRDERLADPKVLAMIERISIEVDPLYDTGGDSTRHCARASLTTKDGRTLKREVLDRPGSPTNPLPPQHLQRKFETLAGAVLPQERIAKVIKAVAGLEDGNTRSLMDLVTPSE